MKRLSHTFDALFEHKRDSIVRVMELLLLSLLMLSASVHLLINTVFDGSVPPEAQWKIFAPEYFTLTIAYGLMRTKWLKLATHMFLLGMIITQMSVIFFVTGPMSYIYVSYTNVVLIAGLILGPTSAALYTIVIISLMYIYFRAIQSGQLDVMLLEHLPYATQLEMIVVQACMLFTGLTVSYFIIRQSRLHHQMLKEQARTKQTLRDLQQAEALNALRAKQDAMIGWMGQQFIQAEYPQSFFETTLPRVFDTISLQHLIINGLINHQDIILASKDSSTGLVSIQFLREESCQQALLDNNTLYLRQLIETHSSVQQDGIIQIHRSDNYTGKGTSCQIVTISETPLEYADAFLTTLSNMFTAVLQRAHTESQLRQLQKMETLNRVAGSVAHDFNNLLMSIMSSTDFALSQVERNEILHDTLLQINWASERGKGLTRKLLSFSRSESFEPKPISVHTIIREMTPIIKQITRDNIDFQVQYSTSDSHIHIDQQDFENSLLNLIINARDAIDNTLKDNRSITLVIDTVEDEANSTVSISILDTGSGIPKSDYDKIFEPFYTTKLNGTGLGLSMVRSVVERANGTIEIKSSTEGSNITMVFPLMQSNQPTKVDTVTGAYSKTPLYSLLIVDDEPLVRQMLAEYLSRHQFNTHMAENVEQAKNILRRQSIDLILSDVNMPGESGISLHKYCQQNHPNTQFIMMTGFTSEAIDESIMVLSKPMRMPVLLEQIQNLMCNTAVDA